MSPKQNAVSTPVETHKGGVWIFVAAIVAIVLLVGAGMIDRYRKVK